MAVITLTTDFGTQDHYVGVMKGAILRISPDVSLVDITHEIAPGDVEHGAFILREAWPFFPPGTIHLAVVDPGVGSDRRLLVGKYAGCWVVAPDNGLLTFIHRDLAAQGLFCISNPEILPDEVSATFHGRDVMAPVAAHLANGVAPRQFGPELESPVLLPVAEVEVIEGRVGGRILRVDRFGTMVTNIEKRHLRASCGPGRFAEVFVNGTSIGPVRTTFSDVPMGQPLAFLGSGGYLEIAINRGRAIDCFGPRDTVQIELRYPE